VELRQLRYFVAVAEELHFSRAALRLNLAQSALSTQIRRLEEELGGPLLVRDSRNVTLTRAGEALLVDARELIAAADRAWRRARGLAHGGPEAIVVGCLGPAPGELLAPLLTQFRGARPEVRVEVHAFDFADILVSLRQRRADLVFTYLPVDEPDLTVTPLLEEPRVVVLAATHPLASRSELRPADLADATFISQPDTIPQRWRDFWLLVDELGERPSLAPRLAATLEEWLHLIAAGQGIDTAPEIVSRYYSWPNVSFVPLVGAPPATLALVRHREVRDPVLDAFAALAERLAAGSATGR
jgi:DNA-binding transcriptional LysR family regulator